MQIFQQLFFAGANLAFHSFSIVSRCAADVAGLRARGRGREGPQPLYTPVMGVVPTEQREYWPASTVCGASLCDVHLA